MDPDKLEFKESSEERARSRRRRAAKKRRARQLRLRILAAVLILVMLAVTAGMIVRAIRSRRYQGPVGVETSEVMSDGGVESMRPDIDVELLDVNSYSRPGIELKQVNGIVIHYTANPGSTAIQNRDYFNGLAQSHTTKASSHFIIGLEGEIVQCIPCNEIAYASNDRNSDTIAIECCIPDETGKFNISTYDSAVELTAWLVVRYGLTADDVIRHYDITGKNCPKYYVENPEAWEQFRQDVSDAMVQYEGLE